jgi:putative peptidoglycan lipid II flippase
MFLKAGALSLALLLASRLLGLLRESAQAAAFGASGLGDVVVLMLTLPDWLAGVLASGALAYVLVPAWATQSPAQVAAVQRKVGWGLVSLGGAMALLLVLWRRPAANWLAGGLSVSMLPLAQEALVLSAIALPAALLAALWVTRLQHERDFTGMYAANLVVNGVLIVSLAWVAAAAPGQPMRWVGAGLLTAMLLRLAWLHRRTPVTQPDPRAPAPVLPSVPVWLWAAMSAGLPLALPFAARSMASRSGEGALATFSYAWKLVELPLVLAIQLVAALAFPSIARALAGRDAAATRVAVRGAFSLAWVLACACAAALLTGAHPLASLLFGWGRMDTQSLGLVGQWGAVGAWGLPPQALIAVAVTVLAARARMRAVVMAYGLGLAVLLAAAAAGWNDGARLMMLLNLLLAGLATAVLAALGTEGREWLPLRSMGISLACLLLVAVISTQAAPLALGLGPGLLAAGAAGVFVIGASWWGSADLRTALAR